MVYLKLKGKKMKTYILLERSYSTGTFGNYLNYHRGWFCEEKAKQRIQGIEFSTKQALPSELVNAIGDIATIAYEKDLRQDFRIFLTDICKAELDRFIKKPSLTTAKAMIKRVIEKVAKDEKINEMRTIKDKLRNIKSAYKLNNKGE
jgi:hypothetical protein